MEIIKQTIYNRLSTLGKVNLPNQTAMSLHSQNNHLLGRVQRRADKLYKQKVETQQRNLNENLKKINSYEVALQAEIDKRTSILESCKTSFLPIPVFKPLDLVVPKPAIFINQLPVRSLVRY